MPLGGMAGVFQFDDDDGMQRGACDPGLHHPNRGILEEDDETNGIDDFEIKDEYTHGPDFKAMNSSIMSEPGVEALELSERTVLGRGGKAGPHGREHFLVCHFFYKISST